MTRHVLLAAIALAALAAPALAQDRRGLVWNDRPSIVFGEDVNIDLKGRVQLDGRWFDPDVGEEQFDVRTVRVGLKGDFTQALRLGNRARDRRAVRRRRDRGSGRSRPVEPKWRFGEWKDVFLNWTTFDALRVKGGRFKMPFGLEQNTSVSDLDFAYRTLGSTKIAPGRDRGVMAYGELFGGVARLRGRRVR